MPNYKIIDMLFIPPSLKNKKTCTFFVIVTNVRCLKTAGYFIYLFIFFLGQIFRGHFTLYLIILYIHTQYTLAN